MPDYVSSFTGAEIDAAVTKVRQLTDADTINEGVAAATEMTDYVVATGTADATLTSQNSDSTYSTFSRPGAWTFRKWLSGAAECWAQVALPSGTHIEQAWGGTLYETTKKSVTFPASLFVGAPVCVMTPGDGATILEVGDGLSAGRTANFWLVRPVADSHDRDYIINVRAVGRWK